MTLELEQNIRVLIVDDNPGDRDLMVAYLEEAMEKLGKGQIDVVLLDLGLPDSQGLDTFCRLHAGAPDVPVVMITGLSDDAVALDAVRSGAQDYLVKGKVNAELLSRVLRYAIERNRLLIELNPEREKREKERHEAAFGALSKSTGVTAGLYGERPLSESALELFAELVKEYGRLLRVSLERQVKRIPRDLSSELQDLADRLGGLGGRPRDVIEIHKAALKTAAETESPSRAQALVMEGRFLVLELMGYLVSFYRRRCVWAFGVREKTKNGDPTKDAGGNAP